MLIDCSNCNVTVTTDVIAEFVKHDSEYHDPTESKKYCFLKCPNCEYPILTRTDIVYEYGELDWGNAVRIFPVNQFHVNPAIPPELRNALTESIQCYQASLYTPTVIMCRRTLEGFCQLMGVSNKVSLVKSLEILKEKEIINSQLYQWATLLRHTGNKAAHNIKSNFNQIDAKDLLDFTIAILDFCYSFKDKFEKFLERQKE